MKYFNVMLMQSFIWLVILGLIAGGMKEAIGFENTVIALGVTIIWILLIEEKRYAVRD